MPPNDNKDLFDGSWSINADPRAIRYENNNNRTYFGWADTAGAVKVAQYDHDAGDVSTPFSLRDFGVSDAHMSPCILVRYWDDWRVMLFYSNHNDPEVRMRVSTNPEDVTAFAAEVQLDSYIQGGAYVTGQPRYSYMNAYYLEDEDKIYLFCRNYPKTIYSTSANEGGSWTAETVVLENANQRPYTKINKFGTGRIMIAANDGHPNELGGALNTLHYCYYEGGGWYNVRGGNLGDPPFDVPNDLETVDPGDTWVLDMVAEPDGAPRIFYSYFPRAQASPKAQLFRVARWNGRNWEVNDVVSEGDSPISADFASGAGSFDHDNIDDLYLSVQEQPGGSTEVFRYSTSDNCRTWQMTKQYTFDSAEDNIRPLVVRNALDEFKVLWHYGTYPDFDINDTVIRWAAK